jgi:DNA-binding NtrC family response regulator
MTEKSEILLNVLVVDDEEDFLNLMLLHLRKKGFQATGVTDPEEALEILQAQQGEFAVIVSDWLMPRMSGNKLIRNARQIDPLMEAIMITSVYGMGSIAKLGFGAFEYLDKPLKSMDELSETVMRAIIFREKRIQRISSNNRSGTSSHYSDQEAIN